MMWRPESIIWLIVLLTGNFQINEFFILSHVLLIYYFSFFSVFMYTTRGLFECDKLIFTAQMSFQILLMRKEINPAELDFLLRFPVAQNVQSPVDFISTIGWGAIKILSTMDEFRNLDRDIENNSKRWRKFIGNSSLNFRV